MKSVVGDCWKSSLLLYHRELQSLLYKTLGAMQIHVKWKFVAKAAALCA